MAAIMIALIISCSGRRPNLGLLEEGVRSILELPAYEQIYRNIIYVDRERSFLVFRTMHAQVLFSIEIRVQAGIDLSRGFRLSRNDDRSVTVALPEAEILLVDADESTIHQYFAKSSGGSVGRLDYYDEIERIKGEIEKDAIRREILTKAESNAQNLILQLLRGAGIEEVRFVTF